MAHLYQHKVHGWRVVYRITFPDGTFTDKTKYSRKKAIAQTMMGEADTLETHSRKKALSKEEIKFFLNMKYLTQEEAGSLAGGRISRSLTWDELGEKYEKWSREECGGYTHKCNVTRLKNVKEFFIAKEISPDEIKKENVEDFIQERRKSVKDDTIEKDLIVLRKLLDHVEPDDNMARKIRLTRRRNKKKQRPLGLIEMQAFMTELDKNTDFLYGILKEFVMVYLYAGMRPSEINRLKPSDIRLDSCKIIVEGLTKTNDPRSIDIHPDLLPVITYLLENKAIDEYLFGRELNGDSISRAIRLVMRSAGLTGVTPYSLRHSFVSYLLKHTRDLAYVMRQAGHKNIKTTEGYIDVIEDPNSPINKLDFGLKSTQKSTTKTTKTTLKKMNYHKKYK